MKQEIEKQFNLKGKLGLKFQGVYTAKNLEEAKDMFKLAIIEDCHGIAIFVDDIEIEENK